MSSTAQHLILGPFFYQGELVSEPKLYHYVPGTTTAKAAWSDYNKTITAENPIRGDANGLVAGYFDGLYKLEVRTHDGAVVLGQWDNVQVVTSLYLATTDEAVRIGPTGDGADAEDAQPRWIRMVGSWSDPADPGATGLGDRIVFYDSDRDKTVLGMHEQNGMWFAANGASGQPAFSVWAAASFTSPAKRFEVTFDGRVKVASGGKLHLPVVATADLPAASADEDGSLLIEDAGAGDRNLIVYAGGERFRIDGGSTF